MIITKTEEIDLIHLSIRKGLFTFIFYCYENLFIAKAYSLKPLLSFCSFNYIRITNVELEFLINKKFKVWYVDDWHAWLLKNYCLDVSDTYASAQYIHIYKKIEFWNKQISPY